MAENARTIDRPSLLRSSDRVVDDERPPLSTGPDRIERTAGR
ncbi:hypothetical protein [Halosimplex amylolyticum]